MSYLNKWHQDTEAFYRANRAESADIINIMQESLREYVAAYNTLISLKKTEESMSSGGVNLDKTIVETSDNSNETLLAFELQSQEFQKVQNDFEEYMERLKEDIDMKAERFGHVEYYDARLRDGYSNEVAVAASEIAELDNRRKALATVNPLLAKTSSLLPEPNVEDITFEHIAINLPAMAKQTLSDLDQMDVAIEETRNEMNEASPVAANDEAVVADEEAAVADEKAPEEGLNGAVALAAVAADDEDLLGDVDEEDDDDLLDDEEEEEVEDDDEDLLDEDDEDDEDEEDEDDDDLLDDEDEDEDDEDEDEEEDDDLLDDEDDEDDDEDLFEDDEDEEDKKSNK